MRIVDQVAKQRILKALADPEEVSILMCMKATSKTAQSIAKETGIPLSTVYRKLEELKAAGLTMTEHFTFSAGRKVDFMTATFVVMRIKLEKNEVEIEVVPTNETVARSLSSNPSSE
jgi:predicted transcriptional regulator